jgi:hypothetical protein
MAPRWKILKLLKECRRDISLKKTVSIAENN